MALSLLVDSSLSLIDHLLDGGSHEAWCERRGCTANTGPGGILQSPAHIGKPS